jgi:hypothetical protein
MVCSVADIRTCKPDQERLGERRTAAVVVRLGHVGVQLD